MDGITTLKPIETLVIGHVTSDLQTDGTQKLGGTVSYAGLTSKALGYQTGILTSNSFGFDLTHLSSLEIASVPAQATTTFENISTHAGRNQYAYSQATPLTYREVPDHWRNPKIVHLGPVIGEIDPEFFSAFPSCLLCLTPQGFHRQVAVDGKISFQDWDEKEKYLPKVDVVVLSLEDLQGDERLVLEYTELCNLLVITENKHGARVYWNRELRHFSAPARDLVEDTGAGDIFAACFFHRFHETQNAWEAARFSVELAANSVTRRYLESIPTIAEIEHAKVNY